MALSKCATSWSKQIFNDLFIGAKIEADYGTSEISEISTCDGLAFANIRKGMKLDVFCDWIIEMKWIGHLKISAIDIHGSINVFRLRVEQEMKDFEVSIMLESSGPEAEILKSLMCSKGVSIIKDKLASYLTSLKDEFPKCLLPTTDMMDTAAKGSEKPSKKNTKVGNLQSCIGVMLMAHNHELNKKKTFAELEFDASQERQKKRVVLCQKYLLSIIHVNFHHSENMNNVKDCRVQYCNLFCGVLLHMKKCTKEKECPFPRCLSTQNAMTHWRKCKNKVCKICWPIKRAFGRRQIELTDDLKTKSF